MNFIKAQTTYEIEVNGNKYQISVPANAPLGEAYDVMFKFLSIIAEQAKISAEQMKPSDTRVREEIKEEKAEVVS